MTQRNLIFCVALVLAALSGCEDEQPAWITEMNKGEGFLGRGDYDTAIACFSEVIQLVPQDGMAYHARGNAYYSKGEFDKAIIDYTAAIRLNPRNQLTSRLTLDGDYHRRGNAHFSKGDYDKAIKDYSASIRHQSLSASGVYNNRGRAHYQKGDYDNALADFTESIRQSSNDLEAYSLRIAVYRKTGDRTKANADSERVKEIFLERAPVADLDKVEQPYDRYQDHTSRN
jgi:tetratricopeptide (TPR) repeat protein